MISIIDYGMGNLRSVSKAFEIQGFSVKVTSDIEDINNASGLVLPGVGAFGDCMKNLREANLVGPIIDFIESGRPFLGICLGLQALFESSEESPEEGGLGLFKGRVVRFPDFKEKNLKVPHMGWNQLSYDYESKILKDIPKDRWFYFVHSYFVEPDQNGLNEVVSDYGIEFTAAVEKGNIFACQFHPEKSGEFGLKILSNFASLCKLKIVVSLDKELCRHRSF